MNKLKVTTILASVTLVAVYLMQMTQSRLLAQNSPQLVRTEYDANKNLTQITLNPIILASRKLEELRMGAISGYPGKVKSKPKEVALVFLSLSKTDENRYELARKLLVIADERRFDWGETQRAKQNQSGLFVETMTVAIPVDDFIFVSNAKQVKLKLGLTVVDLTAAQINALRVMASYLSE
jgi:hypothetical protein